MRFVYFKIDNDDYICKECKFTTPNQNTMHYHLQRHEGTLSYECTSCDKKFFQKYALDNHVKLEHSKAEP